MPSSFNNKQSLWQKLKNKRINRSYLFTVLALVVALVVIIAAAIASNRSKKPTELPDDSGNKITEKPTEKPTEAVQEYYDYSYDTQNTVEYEAIPPRYSMIEPPWYGEPEYKTKPTTPPTVVAPSDITVYEEEIVWDLNSPSSSGVQRADGWITGIN